MATTMTKSEQQAFIKNATEALTTAGEHLKSMDQGAGENFNGMSGVAQSTATANAIEVGTDVNTRINKLINTLNNSELALSNYNTAEETVQGLYGKQQG